MSNRSTNTESQMANQYIDGLRIAITGGTSGLGLALVRELLDRGARVAFVARNREGVERVARERPDAQGIVGDVSQKEDIYPIAIQLLGALGGLDVLVNNASSLGPVPLVPLADTECEDLELALATNVLGPFRLTKALLGALAASARGGRQSLVVNVSTDAGTPSAKAGIFGRLKAPLAGRAVPGVAETGGITARKSAGTNGLSVKIEIGAPK